MAESNFRHVTCQPDEDVLVITVSDVRVRGDEMAEGLRGDLFEAADRFGARKVVLDLQHVQEMSSRACAALAGFRQEIVKRRSGQVALAGLTQPVREALGLLRFIDTRGASPAVDLAQPAPTVTRVKPLFEVVAPDVPAAMARLRAAGT
jgi:anti-anti-sigma regulatory factor